MCSPGEATAGRARIELATDEVAGDDAEPTSMIATLMPSSTLTIGATRTSRAMTVAAVSNVSSLRRV